MKLMILCGFILIQTSVSFTTWDGKEVPALPAPSGEVVTCSTMIQFYMAFRQQKPGRTIVLKEGNYNISSLTPLRIDSNGVTIRGESEDPSKVVLSGRGFDNNYNVDEEMFFINGNTMTFANLTLSESRCHTVKFTTLGVNSSALFHNVRFLNVGERMIKGPSATVAVNCTVRYCHFEDMKQASATRCVGTACESHDEGGNYIGGVDLMKAESWVFHDNVFRNIRGATGGGRGAVFFWHGCKNMIVERNTFIGCDRAVCYGNPHNPDNEIHVIGGIIRNNFIVRGAGIAVEVDYSSDIKVFNNTVYNTDPTYARTVLYYHNDRGNEFKNNIIFGRFLLDSGYVPDSSSNIWKTDAGEQNTNWFADRLNGNLHLTGNAQAAINTGEPLEVYDWDNHVRSATDSLPDIGADEYNSGVFIEGLGRYSDIMSISTAPNPCNPSVTIRCVLHTDQQVYSAIYNIEGKLIRILKTGKTSGRFLTTWEGVDMRGRMVNSGIYFVKAIAGEACVVKKISLIR
ncbi:MAG: hypothetical protein A2268_06185 [Candidatus Raymondbacteria bacterium RifOxyA12_full_50_37]|uniref:Right handed beta helix domain-containing protein n=1 Tax=Candidatus Raymondbacteria bacterium RIFOXYD12_FULL_49_13 TaxID=1817890 RepID=A0A1F7FK75_UNCRA|nr:MAG: hypothetical protein A2268_06185 [Candidatus Raymondbacteria bacterium RifOxyA12_full_50_37]OGJ94557.1 MAG: hypothetical protein A2248_15115 [Candidatus Raymondbacteria bacterium RIFOXYA2_FULL_49_16]OGJ95885.1 MAG: hypothetical protein A2487_02910 [Candidatus Raymondbacteria bacterium RifOxyC12_full_50_8]OGK01706.1 MAG: hypothetical protein A2350_10845 [Candidatus Raymondbacteria bacterium RifOxyB12_full_50_8]OGK07033.1 MAG: hypothetical protein A2519_13755 [Candidatus Raymondbacteria b